MKYEIRNMEETGAAFVVISVLNPSKILHETRQVQNKTPMGNQYLHIEQRELTLPHIPYSIFHIPQPEGLPL